MMKGKRETENRRKHKKGKYSERYKIIAAAAGAIFIIVVFILIFRGFRSSGSTVYLDAGLSFTIATDSKGRVVSIEPNDPDAEVVVERVDCEGKNFVDAVEEIFHIMNKNDYLQVYESTALVSLSSVKSGKKTSDIAGITQDVEKCLRAEIDGGSVFGQKITLNEEISAYAAAHAISPGKASLILYLAENYSELDAEFLSGFTMRELVRYLHLQNIDLRDFMEYTGEDLNERWKNEA